LIADKIKTDEIKRAVDVRDQLPKICSMPKTLKKFANQSLDFESAHEQAVSGGADTASLKKIQNFRNWIANADVRQAIQQINGQPRDKLKYEVKKLVTLVQDLSTKLQSGN